MGAATSAGGGNDATIPVEALVPIHSPGTAGGTGTTEALAGMTDGELLELVARDRLVVDPGTGRVFEGNARAYELQKRAADPRSSITQATRVPYEPYRPLALP